MGNEGSQEVTRMDYAPLYDDRQFTPISLHQNQVKPKKQLKLLQTQYHGLWSLMYPSGIAPQPRYGHCFVYDEKNEKVIIAYGQDKTQYFDDIWEYNLPTNMWRIINTKMLSPRSYASACLIGRYMFIFGGKNLNSFFGDLHCINIDTYEMRVVDIPGSKPSPRASTILFGFDDALFLWGGADESKSHKAIHILRAGTNEWRRHDVLHTGRSAAAFCTFKGVHYIFGSTKGHGLLVFDPVKKTFDHITCTGTEPPHEIEHSALCGADEYLFLIGGEAEKQSMYIYALDLNRKWWFAFHIRPDMETLSIEDGTISSSGLFMLPREHSTSIVYNENERALYSILGSKLLSPPPVFKIAIGPALSSLHMRSDMYEVLHAGFRGSHNE